MHILTVCKITAHYPQTCPAQPAGEPAVKPRKYVDKQEICGIILIGGTTMKKGFLCLMLFCVKFWANTQTITLDQLATYQQEYWEAELDNIVTSERSKDLREQFYTEWTKSTYSVETLRLQPLFYDSNTESLNAANKAHQMAKRYWEYVQLFNDHGIVPNIVVNNNPLINSMESVLGNFSRMYYTANQDYNDLYEKKMEVESQYKAFLRQQGPDGQDTVRLLNELSNLEAQLKIALDAVAEYSSAFYHTKKSWYRDYKAGEFE
jgi:hypothetical protein